MFTRRIDLRQAEQFERAYREHRPRAFAAARHVLHDNAAAEDVVQEVFTQLWLRPHAFDPRRGPLSTYVSLLARSKALDHRRARMVRNSADERFVREDDPVPAASDTTADTAVRHDDARAAMGALSRLPDDQREALLLAYGGGLTAGHIARLQSVPLGTAKSRIRLGRKKARALLEAV